MQPCTKRTALSEEIKKSKITCRQLSLLEEEAEILSMPSKGTIHITALLSSLGTK